MMLDNTYSNDITNAHHLNGLVCFTCEKALFNYNCALIYLLNHSTHKVFKITVPDPLRNHDYEKVGLRYLFGFNESSNEHKILIMRKLVKPSTTIKIMIFPNGFSWDNLDHGMIKDNVCVNSVVHLVPCGPYDILAFDYGMIKDSV
ncbi:hypothetical protein Hanom_Chr02g00141231 [Helianthus anomalus]